MSTREQSTSGATVGGYELLTELVAGDATQGHVARRAGAGLRPVTVKRVGPDLGQSPAFAEAFAEEAEKVAQIAHPNVVALQDAVREGNALFVVTDYVDGASLADVMAALQKRGATLPKPVALRIVVDALRGLHHAHEVRDITDTPLEIVHRDASPATVLVGKDGTVRVVDFGVASAAAKSGVPHPAESRGHVGYQSPEQAAGATPDRRADVFGLGAVAWELLAGKALLGAKREDVMRALLLGEFAGPGASPEVDAVVLKAIARDRSSRWATAGELADALEQAAASVGGLASAAQLGEAVVDACGDAIRERAERVKASVGARAPQKSFDRITHTPPEPAAKPVPAPKPVEASSTAEPVKAVEASSAAEPQPVVAVAKDEPKPIAKAEPAKQEPKKAEDKPAGGPPRPFAGKSTMIGFGAPRPSSDSPKKPEAPKPEAKKVEPKKADVAPKSARAAEPAPAKDEPKKFAPATTNEAGAIQPIPTVAVGGAKKAEAPEAAAKAEPVRDASERKEEPAAKKAGAPSDEAVEPKVDGAAAEKKDAPAIEAKGESSSDEADTKRTDSDIPVDFDTKDERTVAAKSEGSIPAAKADDAKADDAKADDAKADDAKADDAKTDDAKPASPELVDTVRLGTKSPGFPVGPSGVREAPETVSVVDSFPMPAMSEDSASDVLEDFDAPPRTVSPERQRKMMRIVVSAVAVAAALVIAAGVMKAMEPKEEPSSGTGGTIEAAQPSIAAPTPVAAPTTTAAPAPTPTAAPAPTTTAAPDPTPSATAAATATHAPATPTATPAPVVPAKTAAPTPPAVQPTRPASVPATPAPAKPPAAPPAGGGRSKIVRDTPF